MGRASGPIQIIGYRFPSNKFPREENFLAVPAKILGSVVEISSAGDLITDLTSEKLAGIDHGEETKIVVDNEFETFGIYGLDHKQPEMTLIAILEEGQPLRLHLVSDSASMMLGVRKGAKIEVS
jgi:S-adenosylmethionine hydrolase